MKTIIIKVYGDQEEAQIVHLRKQLVAALREEYKIVFAPEGVDLADIEFKILG